MHVDTAPFVPAINPSEQYEITVGIVLGIVVDVVDAVAVAFVVVALVVGVSVVALVIAFSFVVVAVEVYLEKKFNLAVVVVAIVVFWFLVSTKIVWLLGVTDRNSSKS